MGEEDDDLPAYLRGVDQYEDKVRRRQKAPPEPMYPGSTPKPEQRRYIGAAEREAIEDLHDTTDYSDPKPSVAPLVTLGVLIVTILVCVGVLGAVFAGGATVDAKETRAVLVGEALVADVNQREKLIDAVGARGGDRRVLEDLYQRAQGAKGLDRAIASYRFALGVEGQLAQVGDIRGTPLDDSRAELAVYKRDFEEAMVAWESSAGGVLGTLAVTLGVADTPPRWR